MQPVDVIASLAAAPSRLRKDQVIVDAYAANCMDFFEAVQLACDPFINFGIKSVAEIVEDDGEDGSLSFAEFRLLCDQLRTQTLIGDAMRLAVYAAAERCHAVTWNTVYRRILLRDLRVVDADDVNRVIKRLGPLAARLGVPAFRCQTAIPSLAIPKSGQYLVDVKLSGIRLLAVLDKTAVLYNSKGDRCESCSHIEQALRPLAARLPSPIVIDGVLIDGGEYVMFDLIPLGDFRAGNSAKTQRERRVMLELLQTSGVFVGTAMRVLPQLEISFSTRDGKRAFAEFGQQATADGNYAVMIKKSDASYVGKANRNWMQCAITNT